MNVLKVCWFMSMRADTHVFVAVVIGILANQHVGKFD